MDEYCERLVELNLPRPDSRGRHRYRLLYVWRNGQLAEHRKDLGPATDAMQFRLIGAPYDPDTGTWIRVETVGSLTDIAEQLYAGKVEHPPDETSDLFGKMADQNEQRALARRGRGISILTQGAAP